jgi:hypothetical protein
MNAPVLAPNSLPAIKPTNRWKAIDDLIWRADAVVERYDELTECQRKIWRYVPCHGAEELPTDGELELHEGDMRQLSECHELLAALDPENDYEEDSSLKKKIISKRLAALVGAFPAGGPATPEVYTRMLLEHVAAEEDLTALALDTACREIESKQRFLPAISEVLSVVREHIEAWSERRRAIRGIEELSASLIKQLDRPRKEARVAATKALDEARQQLQQAKQNVIAQQTLAAKAARDAQALLGNLHVFEERVRQAKEARDALFPRRLTDERWRGQ